MIKRLISDYCFTADGVSSKKVCSYQDVLEHLNLTTGNSVFKMTRPVKDHTHPTAVKLDIILYAILAVVGAALLCCGGTDLLSA